MPAGYQDLFLEQGTTVYSANSGVIQLSANSATTSNVSTMQKLVYDVIISETSTGSVTRVLEGQIFVSPSVTRN